MVPDTRHPDEIVAEDYAVAEYRGWTRLVRGIDRYTHLPTREPAAMVWLLADALRGAQLVPVALSDIRLFPGRTS
ncbi:hypothetical protein R3P82_12790 [Dietzia maris]|uniref:Uncharacterized protein n=1 Tax=Dietzia maris TaxID=37915 RepID=A0AAE4QYV6_9ACTN|nr:hypothetical protein [Dietzia maris]MDV6299987.1 hypothetical protein [Dietzia maris]